MNDPHQIEPAITQTDFFEVTIPTFELTMSPNRPLPLLVETAVKQWQTVRQGNNPWHDFRQRQQQALQRDAS